MSCRLKGLATLVIDQADRGELPHIALEHLESGTGRLIPDVELPLRRGGETGMSAVQHGDVLFGKLRPYLAKTLLVREPAYASTELMALRPSAAVEARYLAYLAGSRPLIEWATASSEGTKMPRTSWEKLGEFRVDYLPKIEVQLFIADYLDSETARIDALITKKQMLIGLLDQRVTAAISVEMSRAPKHRRLRHLAELGTGHTPNRNKPEYWENCTIPWVTAADLSGRQDPFLPLLDTAQKVSQLGVANSAAVVHPAGTVMLCRTASVGLICEIGMPMATTQAFVTWTPRPELDSTFLQFALVSMSQEWKKLAFGSTHETIYMPDLESVRIPYFPYEDQLAVVERLTTRLEKVKSLRLSVVRQIELLRERRQALITAAVTGQIDIPEVAA